MQVRDDLGRVPGNYARFYLNESMLKIAPARTAVVAIKAECSSIVFRPTGRRTFIVAGGTKQGDRIQIVLLHQHGKANAGFFGNNVRRQSEFQ